MPQEANSSGWLSRLRSGLRKSSTKLSDGISGVFTERKLDGDTLAELEELLIAADLGPATAARLAAEFGKNRFGKDIGDDEVKTALAEQIAALLKPFAIPLVIDAEKKPFVILVVGVNGNGKTTTIGKLARYYAGQGLKVVMAAGDTFRAAAISQLKIWGEHTGVPVIAGEQGGDAAALAYQALEKAQKDKADLLLIDTAGRLHNKGDLMQELAKLARVLKKLDPSAPHATLLALDATTGQNAHAQVETFRDIAQVTGLVVTKLDGSAKGGVVVALADRFKLPIHALGVGEGADDLRPFVAEDFARALVGLR
jgi:fused signal recognition particle receptor